MNKLFNDLTMLIFFFIFSLYTVADDINKSSTSYYENSSDQLLNIMIAEKINALDARLSLRLDWLEDLISKNIKKSEPGAVQKNKIMVGELEWLYLHELDQSFKARVDSGATTSSISANNIQAFERDGVSWVRFTVGHHNAGKPGVIETPVVRHVRIKQASSSNYQPRLVVSLTINLGKHFTRKTEFTLADRGAMSYPMLLGREFLKDIALIDVGKKFLHAKVELEPN
jgi:hypothetical protein